MRKTFGACRRMSSSPMKTSHSMPKRAATVAVATPCWPAPVSAMTRLFAHPPGQQGLAEGVVDLVGAGVVQVLAFQVDPRPAQFLREGRRKTAASPGPHRSLR